MSKEQTNIMNWIFKCMTFLRTVSCLIAQTFEFFLKTNFLKYLDVSWSILEVSWRYLEAMDQVLKCMNFPRTDPYLIVQTFKSLQNFFYDELAPKITNIWDTCQPNTVTWLFKNVPKTSCTYPKNTHKSLNNMNMIRAFPAQFMFNMVKDLWQQILFKYLKDMNIFRAFPSQFMFNTFNDLLHQMALRIPKGP